MYKQYQGRANRMAYMVFDLKEKKFKISPLVKLIYGETPQIIDVEYEDVTNTHTKDDKRTEISNAFGGLRRVYEILTRQSI